MEEENKGLDYGEAFVLFIIAVATHNTFAPREFRQELNEYSLKCYCIIVLLALLYAYIKDRIRAKRKQDAIDAEKERIRRIRERMEQRKKEEEN